MNLYKICNNLIFPYSLANYINQWILKIYTRYQLQNKV